MGGGRQKEDMMTCPYEALGTNTKGKFDEKAPVVAKRSMLMSEVLKEALTHKKFSLCLLSSPEFHHTLSRLAATLR